MNYKQFKTVFANVLLPLGFTNVKNMFFRRAGDIFAIVDLQKSDWGGDYFVNIGIYVADNEKLKQPPPFRNAHLKQRLEAIVPRPVCTKLLPALDLEIPMSAAERSLTVTTALEDYAVPYLNTLATIEGIADYLRPEKRNFAGVTLALREIIARRTGQEQSAAIGIVVERHNDGFIAYPVGLKGIVVGQGDTQRAAIDDVRSAIQFHIATFGPDAIAQGLNDKEK